MQGEYRAVIALKWFATEMRKIAKFNMPKMSKITHNFFLENVEN